VLHNDNVFIEERVVPLGLGLQGFFEAMGLVVMVKELDGLFEGDGERRPMTMVAMWMKKSRQVWTDSWGGWTSSMGYLRSWE